MFEIVIVGSGLSGVAAALCFVKNGLKPCVLDAGFEPRPDRDINENLYSYRERNDSFDLLIGEGFEGLSDLDIREKDLPVKLTSPRMKFVTQGSKDLSPVRETGFRLVQSFAQGGLANAWGAGVYRYNDRDLKRFPLKESELLPYYESLEKEMGVSGENDDLTRYFGRVENLQTPLRLSSNASKILKAYHRKKKKLNEQGVFIGRPRLAVLSEALGPRKGCDYSNLEFWLPDLPYIYTPSQTLKELIRQGKIVYRKGLLVRSWSRKGQSLVVHAESIECQERLDLECQRLILAAGAVNSAKLALNSRRDFHTRLTLLDNPALQFPFILPGRIGCRMEKDAFGLTQLNVIYDSEPEMCLLQGSILEITSPARAIFFPFFPFAARDNLRLIRYLLPTILVMQLFFPAYPDEGSTLSLSQSGELEIQGKKRVLDRILTRKIIRVFRSLGAYAVSSMITEVPAGHGIHYGGTLPMREPSRSLYTCDKFGELYGEPGVHAVDGSLFPVLAAKNLSLAMMANAMRIADHISRVLRR